LKKDEIISEYERKIEDMRTRILKDKEDALDNEREKNIKKLNE
jgi:hypothetical protein